MNGCTMYQDKQIIFQDLTYTQIHDIASYSEKPFCIVLFDSTFNLSSYKDRMKDYQIVDHAIWNFANTDTNQNLWYKFLFGTEKTPFTLVFNQNGTLKNIVYGISQYAFKSIRASLTSMSKENRYIHFGFLENSIINIIPQNINSFFNNLIKIESDFNNCKRPNYDSIIASINELEYPYNLYLRIKYEDRYQNKNSSIVHAKELLNKYSNSNYAGVFSPLLMSINKSINRNISNKDEFYISTSLNKYNCHLNDTISIKVLVTNNTNSTVEIKKFEPSCNCIVQTKASPMTIPPKQIVNYEFYFITEDKGEIYREIYFYTNRDLPVAIANFKVFVQ